MLSETKSRSAGNKVLGSLMGVGMLLLSAVPALAVTNVTNNLTGYNSYNKIWVNRTSNISVDNYQTAFVKNKVNSSNNTGDNKIKFNTVAGGGIITGNTTSNITVNNTVNGALTAVNNCGCQGDVNAANDTTGADSTNKITVNDSSSINVSNMQLGVVSNYISSHNSTGGNRESYNTVAGGDITTGNATSNVTVDNFVNAAETVIGPVGP